MSERGWAARLLTAGLAVALVGGCAYFNSLYNARRLFGEAEEARWSGQTSTAHQKYDDAILKAARSFRSDPDGRWADDALVLMGRAYLQRGDWERARGALEHAMEISGDDEMRARARLYLGALEVATGNPSDGVPLLDTALTRVDDGRVRAEGHLWRARGHLASGQVQEGWDDLDAVAGGGERFRVLAEMERLTWAVEVGDTAQARRGARSLLTSQEGQGWADSLSTAAEGSVRIWGPAASARLLEGAAEAPWTPASRSRVLLRRARLLAAAGDTARAIEDARRVSSGVGRLADEARVLEARLRLSEVKEVEELDRIRSLLLPAVGSREAVELLEWIKKIGLMVDQGGAQGQKAAFFAAAELARDSLEAPLLAGQLFQVYATQDRGTAWEGKALIAAVQLTPDPQAKARLLARLDSIPDNVYAQALHRKTDRELDYAAVERRLRAVLDNIHAQVNAEAQHRDVLVSETARLLDSIRMAEEIRERIAEGDSALLDSLRADSILQDSIRMDSIRRADSILRDTAFFEPDSFPPDTTRSGPPRPILVRLRPGPVPGGGRLR